MSTTVSHNIYLYIYYNMENPKFQYSYIKNLYKKLVKTNPFLESILTELSQKYKPDSLERIPQKYEKHMKLILNSIIDIEGRNTSVMNAQELRRLMLSNLKHLGVNPSYRVKKPFINSPVPQNIGLNNPFVETNMDSYLHDMYFRITYHDYMKNIINKLSNQMNLKKRPSVNLDEERELIRKLVFKIRTQDTALNANNARQVAEMIVRGRKPSGKNPYKQLTPPKSLYKLYSRKQLNTLAENLSAIS